MMEIYPFGGFLSYLKFHFIDGVNKQSVMLLDKTRVDYDSKKKKEVFKSKAKTGVEINDMLKGFGIGKKKTNEQRIEQVTNELEQ